MPKDYLLAGKMQIEQTKHYISKGKRLIIAKKFVAGAAFNILKICVIIIPEERKWVRYSSNRAVYRVNRA
jgi:CRISPR/Cas system-associated endonuclease Cas1